MKRLIFPLVLGLGGCAILLALGVWQVQRQVWKNGILAEIEARIAAAPIELPVAPDPVANAWAPVTVSGELAGEELRVLTTNADLGGPGYRVISVLTAGDRRIMVDLGYIPETAAGLLRMAPELTVTGNLHWPDEVDGWTPEPDQTRNIWFARDVPAMAAALNAEPFLVVARTFTPVTLGAGRPVVPLPIDTATIPNNHTQYAITWFLMAAVWAAMSGLLIWRQARRT
jgi:surfeit locus 1 family protein